MEYLVVKNTFLDVEPMDVMVAPRSRSCPATPVRVNFERRQPRALTSSWIKKIESETCESDIIDTASLHASDTNETFTESDSMESASVHTSEMSGSSIESDSLETASIHTSEMSGSSIESDSLDTASVHTSEMSGTPIESDITEAASLDASELSADMDVKRNKTYRPCRAKRNRFLKLVKRLEAQVLEDPKGFSMDNVTLPPSLVENHGERQKLFDLMESFQYKVLTSDQV